MLVGPSNGVVHYGRPGRDSGRVTARKSQCRQLQCGADASPGSLANGVARDDG